MKYRLSIYIMIFALICVASEMILKHTAQPVVTTTHSPEKNTVDSFLIHPIVTQYDKDGFIKMKMTADKLTHYKMSGETVLEKPFIITYSEKNTPWHIHADRAISNKAGDRIVLKGHVNVHELQTAQHPETTITTTELTVFPKESRAVTDKFVTLSRPGTLIHGVGLIANLKTGQYQLRSESEAIYEPTPSKKSHKE